MVASGREPAVPTASPNPAEPPPTQEDWQPPSEFDQIKELNAQGGRLTTLYGLLLTAYTFSAGSEPIRRFLVAVYGLSFNTLSVLFLIDAIAGLGALVIGLASALATTQPPVPSVQSQEAYLKLRTAKFTSAGLSGGLVFASLLALLAVWGAVAAIPTGNPRLDGTLLLVTAVLTVLTIASVASVLFSHRGLVRQLLRP